MNAQKRQKHANNLKLIGGSNTREVCLVNHRIIFAANQRILCEAVTHLWLPVPGPAKLTSAQQLPSSA